MLFINVVFSGIKPHCVSEISFTEQNKGARNVGLAILALLQEGLLKYKKPFVSHSKIVMV